MLNDVTFGQYYPVKSFVHRCDPRLKTFGFNRLYRRALPCKNFYAMAACVVVLVSAVIASRVPVGSVLRSVKAVIFLLIFTAVINLFFHGGQHLLVEWGIIKIYREGIIFTVFFVLRLFFLVMGSALLTLTQLPSSLPTA